MIDVSELPPNEGIILLLIERAGVIEKNELLKQSPNAERTLDNLLTKLRHRVEKTKRFDGKNTLTSFRLTLSQGDNHHSTVPESPSVLCHVRKQDSPLMNVKHERKKKFNSKIESEPQNEPAFKSTWNILSYVSDEFGEVANDWLDRILEEYKIVKNAAGKTNLHNRL